MMADTGIRRILLNQQATAMAYQDIYRLLDDKSPKRSSTADYSREVLVLWEVIFKLGIDSGRIARPLERGLVAVGR